MAYVRAFETLEPEPILKFYNLPATFVSPMGSTVVADTKTARDLVLNMITQARSQGYNRTEIIDLNTKLLSKNLAQLSGIFVRLNAHGLEVGRFGVSYLMIELGAEWKIAVAVAHDLPGHEH